MTSKEIFIMFSFENDALGFSIVTGTVRNINQAVSTSGQFEAKELFSITKHFATSFTSLNCFNFDLKTFLTDKT